MWGLEFSCQVPGIGVKGARGGPHDSARFGYVRTERPFVQGAQGGGTADLHGEVAAAWGRGTSATDQGHHADLMMHVVNPIACFDANPVEIPGYGPFVSLGGVANAAYLVVCSLRAASCVLRIRPILAARVVAGARRAAPRRSGTDCHRDWFIVGVVHRGYLLRRLDLVQGVIEHSLDRARDISEGYRADHGAYVDMTVLVWPQTNNQSTTSHTDTRRM